MKKKYIRKCPECSNEITYCNKYTHKLGVLNNSLCNRCRVKGNRNPMYGRTGNKNPFYGKHHTEESKNKKRINTDYSVYKTKEFRQKCRRVGKKNGMYGKSFYDVWLAKYGKEEADKKLLLKKQKNSAASSGKKNGMYGKPSPQGSGNGWSGWYKEHYFRSLRELIFIIKIIERYNFNWITGETKNIKIQYEDYYGQIRNYFPDFILNNKYMIEIKPKKLWKSYTTTKKKNKAIEYCKQNNLKYKLIDINISKNLKLINELYKNKQIKFTGKSEERYNKWITKNNI